MGNPNIFTIYFPEVFQVKSFALNQALPNFYKIKWRSRAIERSKAFRIVQKVSPQTSSIKLSLVVSKKNYLSFWKYV